MPTITALIRRWWIGYLRAVGAYAAQNPPTDLDQIMEDLGWNQAQDDLFAFDGNYVPQSRTIT